MKNNRIKATVIVLLAALFLVLSGFSKAKDETTSIPFSGRNFSFYGNWEKTASDTKFTRYDSGNDFAIVVVGDYDKNLIDSAKDQSMKLANALISGLDSVEIEDPWRTTIDDCKAIVVPFNGNKGEIIGRLYCIDDKENDQSIIIGVAFFDEHDDDYFESFDNTIAGQNEK